jgi:hypothetical protein
MPVPKKYMSSKSLDELPCADFSDIVLLSSDSVDEGLLAQTILDSGKAELLCALTIQMAVIGTGGKDYAQFKYKNTTYDTAEVFRDVGVLFNNRLDDNLGPEILTPRRLMRMFRRHISRYLESTGASSYLFKKYSPGIEEFRHLTFPGSEHMVEDEAARHLFAAYKELDKIHGTDICTRIERVFNARKVKY